jgi:hypothetical protein
MNGAVIAAAVRRVNATLATLSPERRSSIDLAGPWYVLQAELAAAGSHEARAAAIETYETTCTARIEKAA